MERSALKEPPPTSESGTPRDRLKLLGIGIVAGFFIVDGILRTFYFYFNELAEGDTGHLGPILINELTGSLAALLVFFLVVIPMTRRFPLRRGVWKARLGIHVGGLMVYSVGKTLIMWGLRIPTWAIFGFGQYDYGLMLYRIPMEGANDVLSYGIFVAVVHFWDSFTARQERALREARLETRLQEARLEALQGKLQPHFLFNTLNTISSVMYGDPAQADRLISRLSDLLRTSLAAPSRPEVALEEELEILDRYLELMDARFGDRMTVKVEVEPGAHGCAVPIFILQPLVENAIHHGVARKSGPARIDVAITRADDRIRVVVQDDGPGVDGDPEKAVGAGVGLKNTMERLDYLYGGNAEMRLENRSEEGLKVVLDLPYRAADAHSGQDYA